ncbi:EGF-like domain-containing protein [Tieghemostelium lacteum]|uniref:EGF-like domain-containing protein n=1 Tax=Tieghemostelium lacteum TaxID=361077 RepID=A0A151ZIB6_TIELA|nr:EGF-like domain-containing protein [Tieghemostelium lacteum]|eukprot:KYQ93620.1 EGF-like domain-containing protein [Tieghemostelium lacteum]
MISIRHIVIILISLGFISKSSHALIQNQYDALVSINTALGQNWNFDTSNVCTQVNFKCDSTNTVIVLMNLVDPGVVSLPMPSAVYLLQNLTTLNVPVHINIGSDFWNGISSFNFLTYLYVTELTEALPDNIGLILPRSLETLHILVSIYSIPESFFSKSNLKSVTLLTLNTAEYYVLPTTLSQPSPLEEMYTVSFGSFMQGTQFPNLTLLGIRHKGSTNPMSYNSYNTWQATSLTIYNGEVPMHTFPTSILSMPKLQFLFYDTGNRLLGSNFILNFSNVMTLIDLKLYSFPISVMSYPAFSFYNRPSVFISNSTITFSILNMFSFSSVYFDKCVFLNNLPNGNYSSLYSLTIADSPAFTQNILDSTCQLKDSLSITGTGITSLPSCFICEWNTLKSSFTNNPSLPAYTQSCPGFQILNNTNDIPTNGGKMDINGLNLGWNIYNQYNFELINSQLLVGNEKFTIEIGPGSGVGKVTSVKFHSEANPHGPVYELSYKYQAPQVYNAFEQNGNALFINGTNFFDDSSKIQVYIAGKLVGTDGLTYFSIITKVNTVKYGQDLIVSLKVVVDGQSTQTIVAPAQPFSTVLDQTFPTLYSGGGYAIFTGEYLSYDTTIMNLTVNGIMFSLNIVESNSTQYLIKYDPIPPGSYPLEFNQLGYHLSGTIQVNNSQTCPVVHGYCLGPKPVCYSPYTGPDCSSLPANLTRIPFNDFQPIIQTSNTFQTVWKGEVYNFKFFLAPKSIQEIDSSGNVVGNYLPVGSYTLKKFPDSSSYTSPKMNSTTFVNAYEWFQWFGITRTSTGDDTPLVPSTYFYTMSTTTLNTNHFEYKYQITFEMVNPTIQLCSRVETGPLPTQDDVDYMKLKLNYLNLYTRIYKHTAVDVNQVALNYTTKTVSQQAQSINQEITITSPNSELFSFDLDFTVLFDEKSASSEASPICNNFTPPPTTPSDKPCPGTPQCGGASQGICNSGQCQCIAPWKGYQCDSKGGTLPPTDPDPNNPNLNQTTNDLAVHISIVSIRELDYNGVLVKEQPLSNWTYKKYPPTTEKQTFHYHVAPFANNNETVISVTVDYFYKDSQVEFAGQSFSKSTGSYKYSANITNWPFLKKTNQLQIVFLSGASDNQDSDNSCTVKNIAYSQDADLEDDVETVYIQVNGQTFQNKFINLAIVDGMIRQIRNIQLPDTEDDSNTQSNSLVGVLTPYHENFVVIDPDFSLLVSTVPADEKEGSICSKSKSKFTKGQLAGIIVGSVAGFIVLAVILGYILSKNVTVKVLLHKTHIIKMK